MVFVSKREGTYMNNGEIHCSHARLAVVGFIFRLFLAGVFVSSGC